MSKNNKFVVDNTPNQPSLGQNQVEINDDALGTYSTNNQTKLKKSMMKPSLCDYSDVYILVSETRTMAALGASGGITVKG